MNQAPKIDKDPALMPRLNSEDIRAHHQKFNSQELIIRFQLAMQAAVYRFAAAAPCRAA